jgi:hypothetical protein
MRELRDWHGHGEHRPRHAHDATADAPARHARDTPKHAAHDGLKLKMLLDPEFRKAEHLRYRKTVDAYEPKHAAGKLKPQEAKPEQAPSETRDKPAAGIAKRRLEESNQVPDVAAKEKPRFKDKAVAFWAAASGWAVTTAADHLHVIPPGLASEIAGAIGVVALGILWRQSERTENRDGNRPKD